jgi:hypothetical protein
VNISNRVIAEKMGKKTVVIVFNVMLEMSDFFMGTVLDSVVAVTSGPYPIV